MLSEYCSNCSKIKYFKRLPYMHVVFSVFIYLGGVYLMRIMHTHVLSQTRACLYVYILTYHPVWASSLITLSRLHACTHTGTHTGTHTHTHTHRHTHTHTHVGFYGLRGLSIGVMVFILYKLYVLLPYTYPTPKLSPHRRRCISTFP